MRTYNRSPYSQKDPMTRKIYMQIWYENNKDKVRKSARQWYAENREWALELSKMYRKANKEKILAYQAAYRAAHKKNKKRKIVIEEAV